MKIDCEHHHDVTILILEGRLDATTTAALDSAFSQAFGNGSRKFVWDLEKLHYISSAGLRSVLQAMKSVGASQGCLALCSPSASIMEVFEISGFKSLLSIHPNRAAAMRSAA